MRAPIRLGLQILDFNVPGVEPDGLLEKLVEIATTAEESGFDSLFVMDHLHQIEERFERLEDALRIVRLMFTQEESDYEGRQHRVRGVLNNPQPIRGDIPIMVGGSGERKTLRLVAQYADACNLYGDADRVRHLLGVLDRHCEDVGRDPAGITKTSLEAALVAPTEAEVRSKFERLRPTSQLLPERLESMILAGGPDRLGEQAQELFDAGLDGLIVNLPDAYDLETVALAGETLGRLVPART